MTIGRSRRRLPGQLPVPFSKGDGIGRRRLSEVSSLLGARAAGKLQSWSDPCGRLVRPGLPCLTSTSGQPCPLQTPRAQGIAAGCAWPDHTAEHLAAQRNKMKALLQALGVRVQSTHVRAAGPSPAHGTPLVPTPPQDCPTAHAPSKRPRADASHFPEPADADGPSSAQGPPAGTGSHKRPRAAADELAMQVSLPMVIDSSSSSDVDDSPADPPALADPEAAPAPPCYSPCKSGGTDSPENPCGCYGGGRGG